MNVQPWWQLSFISLFPPIRALALSLLLISIIIQNRQPPYHCYMSRGSTSACHLHSPSPFLPLVRFVSLSLTLNICQWLATCCGVVSGWADCYTGCCGVDRITAPWAQELINMKQSQRAVASAGLSAVPAWLTGPLWYTESKDREELSCGRSAD